MCGRRKCKANWSRDPEKKGGEGEGNENTFGLLFRSAICASATVNCAPFLFPFPLLQYYSYSFSRESRSCNHARPGCCENARRSMPPDWQQPVPWWMGWITTAATRFSCWHTLGVRCTFKGGAAKNQMERGGGRGGVRTRKTCFAFPFFFFLPLPSPNNPNLPPKKRGSRKTCNARVSTMCRRGGWTWSVSSRAAPEAKDSGRKRCLDLWVFFLQRVPYPSAGSVR